MLELQKLSFRTAQIHLELPFLCRTLLYNNNNNNNNDNNNIHICIAPYGRNFKGATLVRFAKRQFM